MDVDPHAEPFGPDGGRQQRGRHAPGRLEEREAEAGSGTTNPVHTQKLGGVLKYDGRFWPCRFNEVRPAQRAKPSKATVWSREIFAALQSAAWRRAKPSKATVPSSTGQVILLGEMEGSNSSTACNKKSDK